MTGGPRPVQRGTRRLLHDLVVIGLAHSERDPVQQRLDRLLGAEFVAVVLYSLGTPPRAALRRQKPA